MGRALAEIERGLTSDPNYWASYRAAMLYMMTLYPDDPLGPWRRGLGLDDVVFRVAPVFPIEWIGEGVRDGLPFYVDEFLRQLRDDGGGWVQ